MQLESESVVAESAPLPVAGESRQSTTIKRERKYRESKISVLTIEKIHLLSSFKK